MAVTLTGTYDFQVRHSVVLSIINRIGKEGKVKQSRYRPGVSQRVPGS